MLKKLFGGGAATAPSVAAVQPGSPASAGAAILDQYVREAPGPQLALDLFKGEWWSSLPEPWNVLQAGQLPLFADSRITWGIQAMGGVAGKSVLELGPLEGGHTYMLEKAGARSVVAVESNARAYMKCLILKELLGLQRARFLFGDFEAFLRQSNERFDAVVASGVLYHLRNPVELIANLARTTDRVLLWTHYYVAERVAAIPHMAPRMKGQTKSTHGGFEHTLHRYEYGDFLDTNRFAGGSEHYSNWLGREDLLGALRHFGFGRIVLGEEEVANPNGPCILLAAMRQ